MFERAFLEYVAEFCHEVSVGRYVDVILRLGTASVKCIGGIGNAVFVFIGDS